MFAVGNSDLQIVKYLIERGANPKSNEGSDLSFSVLMWAAEKGNLEIVKLLVQYGADVNSRMTDGTTALKVAKQKGHTAVVEFLNKAGAKR
jgi:uncharacterized protein